MRRAAYRLADFLIYSNLFIAVCAGGFLLATYRLLGLEPRFDALTVLACGATLALYLALRIHASMRLKGLEESERLVWVDRNKWLSWSLLVVGLGLCLWSLPLLDPRVWWALAPAAVLAFAYGLPFLPLPQRFRLRRRNFLKIFLIAGIWAWVAVVLPAAHLDMNLVSLSLWALFASRFFFVLGITLPFDIRDIEIDRVFHLETIPAAIGVGPSVKLAWASLAVSWFLLLPVYLTGTQMVWLLVYAWLPLLPLYLITAWAIGMSRRTKNDYLYLGLLDGTMLLQWVVLEGGLGDG